MSTTDNLPNYFFIESHYGFNAYNNFGLIFNPIVKRETQDDFIDFIKNESEYKSNANLILSNMNYISYLFISPTHCDNDCFRDEHEKLCDYISKQLLKERYPKIYDLLLHEHKVIIAWCMGRHDESFCNECVYCCDCIETRIKNNTYYFGEYALMRKLEHVVAKRISTDDIYGSCMPTDIATATESVYWSGNLRGYVDDEDNPDYEMALWELINDSFKYNKNYIYQGLCPLKRYCEFKDELCKKFDNKEIDYLKFINKYTDDYNIGEWDTTMCKYVDEQYKQHYSTNDYDSEEVIDEIINHLMQMKYPEYKPKAE